MMLKAKGVERYEGRRRRITDNLIQVSATAATIASLGQ